MATEKSFPLSTPQLRAVARLFGVLAEPSRLALLQTLQSGPRSVTDLVESTGMKQANVSKHLAVLLHHHLVERERQGSTVFYSIADPMIFPLCGLVCGKMERDAAAAAALFRPVRPPRTPPARKTRPPTAQRSR